MATPFRSRLNTLMTALRWTLSGDPETATTLKAQMGSVEDVAAQLPVAPTNWLFSRNNWEGDGRWLWLVNPKDSGARSAVTTPRLAWHMAYLWASDKGERGLTLFWSAALEAAKRASTGGEEDERSTRLQVLRTAQGTMARALLETFPQEAKKALPWEEAQALWCTSDTSVQDKVLRAYLSVLARPEHLEEDLQDVSKDALQTQYPKEWPWALWLVINNEGTTLQRDLTAEGGASQWPGVQGWKVPSPWVERIDGRAAQCALALREINAIVPTHPNNKFRTQPPVMQEMLTCIAANSVHMAAGLFLPDSLKALIARGVNPNVLDAQQRLPLDCAVENSRLGTARVLVEGGAMFSLEQPECPSFADSNPWSLLYTATKRAHEAGFREAWLELEKAMWTRGEVAIRSKWTPQQQIKMAYDVASHPHASESFLRLFRPTTGLSARMLLSHWLATVEPETNTRMVRSLLSLAVHNPSWSQADKEVLIDKAFTAMHLVANDVIDDYAGAGSLQTKEWEGVSARPVNALTYAIVHAPRIVPALLARSSAADIQAALASTPSSIGWQEGTTAKAAQAIGITHGWRKFQPIWGQARGSIDPPAAFAALAGHPLTRADRDVTYPLPVRDETLLLTGLEYAMVLTDDSHSATEMLQAAGPVAAINPVALAGWCKAPRDLDALRTGLSISGCVDAPADALGSTLLMRAYENKDRPLVDMLVDLGARLDGTRSDGVSLQAIAAASGPEWVEGLVKARSDRMGIVLGDTVSPSAPRPRF